MLAAISTQTVWQFLKAGGPVMVPIGLCSVVVLAYALERCLALRAARVRPRAFAQAIELTGSGQHAQALATAAGVEAPATRILAAGLRRRGATLPEVERAIEDQGRKELERLRANIRPIALMASISPLLGLFGTVFGILEAFHQVAEVGMGKPEMLARGIEFAGVATVAGLGVAIPATVLASWLAGLVRRRLQEIDDRIAPLVESLVGRQETGHAA